MKQYIVDAFTKEVFAGNPAAVCFPDRWPEDALMCRIAAENNLSETAFVVREGENLRIRWFTPGGEIDLCGHATLATAYLWFRFVEPEADQVIFQSLSGPLTVTREGDLLAMDFPSYALSPTEVTEDMTAVLGICPREAWLGRDLLCVLDRPEDVTALKPDLGKALDLPGLLLHVTAPGEGEFDCVSRSFAPKLRVDEDPVCGSGHCHIAPYWSKRLGKDAVMAYQASSRGGTLYCRVAGDQAVLAGYATLFSQGEILADR